MRKTVKKTLAAAVLAAVMALAGAGGGVVYQAARAEGATESKTLANILNENNTNKGGAVTGTLFEYELMYGDVAAGTLNSFKEGDTLDWNRAASADFVSGQTGVDINAGWRIFAPATEAVVRVKALQDIRLNITHPEMAKDTAWQLEQSFLTVYYSIDTTTLTLKQVALSGMETVAADAGGATVDVTAGTTVYWTYKTEGTRYLNGTVFKDLTFTADSAAYDAENALSLRDGLPSAFHTYQHNSEPEVINTLIKQTANADGGAIEGRDLTVRLLYGKAGGTLTAFKPNADKTELQTQDGAQAATNWRIFATANEHFVFEFTADRYDARIALGHDSYTNEGWSDDGGFIRAYIRRGENLIQLTEVDITGRGKDTFAKDELFGGLSAISLSKDDVFYVEFGVPDTITSRYNITDPFRFTTSKGANAYQLAAIAGTELDTYYGTLDLTRYSDAGKERLSAALSAAKVQYIVDTAAVTDDAGRDAALAAAKALLDEIPTADEELVADTLKKIEELHSALKESDYAPADWTTLETAYTAAKTAASAATTQAQADEAVAAYERAIAAVKTILDGYKEEKIAGLAAYYDPADYSETNGAKLAALVTSYTAAIRAAGSTASVDEQVAAFEAAADKIKTLADELADAKTEYKAKLDEYRTALKESAYSADALAEIDEIIAAAKTDIDGCETASAVKETYDGTVTALEAVTTVVGEYRAAQKAELTAYIDALTGDYAPSAQTELDEIYEDFAAAVDAVEVEDASVEADVTAAKADIDKLLTEAKAAADAVPTTAEQLAAYKADCVAEIKAYLAEKSEGKSDDFKAAAQAVVTAAETAINAAADGEAVAELTAKAKYDVDKALTPAAPPAKKGCGGAIGSVSLALALLALTAAAGMALRKKRA